MSQKIGFTAGAFDLFHAGHALFLRECKKRCDLLIVGLHVDPSVERPEKNRPVMSEFERTILLQENLSVDGLYRYETEKQLIELLGVLPIDVRFLGSEYELEDRVITGEGLVPIEFIKRNHSWSSTELRERIKNDPARRMG